MFYQTSDGRTLELSVEAYLDMSDEELENFIVSTHGQHIQDPWFGSAISSSVKPQDDDILDLTRISYGEKLTDPDLNITED